MPIARIAGGEILERRDDLSIDDVPEHKRSTWLPVEGAKPDVNTDYATLSGPTYQIEHDRVVCLWTMTPRDLATVKAEALARVEQAAEVERAKYLTLLVGKSMSYERKLKEASEVLNRLAVERSGGEAFVPSPDTFLLLTNIIGRYVPNTGVYKTDVTAAANLIVSRSAACALAEQAIDAKEADAKIAIDLAKTHDDVAAALAKWS